LQDDFLALEERFNIFHGCPYSVKSAAHRIATISCILFSLKPIHCIKFHKIVPSPVIGWLASNKEFIEADALGQCI